MSTMDPGKVRLTQTVKKGGCAAKLPAGQLRQVLGSLSLKRPRELLVGTETLDDACLWDLADGRLLVQTLDFFTPIVDDAEDFGAIAAANAISDVYAMGGTPATALSILAFPAATLPFELLGPLLKGACAKIEEAGACLAGGHTIDDETLKLGFAVTGFVAKDRAWKNRGARPGDVLILTKGLGTGTITTGLKVDEADADAVAAAIESMKQLNRVADLIGDADVHAATDVTGFGLAGHALQMAEASEACFVIETARLPELPGALASIENGCLNRAHHTNRDYARAKTEYAGVSVAHEWLTVDPQTSGGLLLAVDAAQAEALLGRLRARFPRAAIIGRVEASRGPGAPCVRFV